jgi:hypothetical protein
MPKRFLDHARRIYPATRWHFSGSGLVVFVFISFRSIIGSPGHDADVILLKIISHAG